MVRVSTRIVGPKCEHRKDSKAEKMRDAEPVKHKKSEVKREHEHPKKRRHVEYSKVDSKHVHLQKTSSATCDSGNAVRPPPGLHATFLVENCIANKICNEHFGLELNDLQMTLRMQAKKLENKLGQLSHIHLKGPNARTEFGSTLIRDMLSISKVATDHLTQAFITMHSTINTNMRSHTDTLQSELARSHAALHSAESEKINMEAEACIQLKKERALLEAAIRDELQTCQICQVNPRNILIVPCFHGHYCADCLEKHQKTNKTCPTCRTGIRGTLPYIA